MMSVFGTAYGRWNIHKVQGIKKCMTLANFPQKGWEHCFRKGAFGWKKNKNKLRWKETKAASQQDLTGKTQTASS